VEYLDYADAAERILARPRSWEIDVEQLLEQSQGATQERVERELERLEEQLEEREAIHQTIINELEKNIDWYVDQLRALYTGFSVVNADKSTRLKREISTFYQELRQERRDHWQDCQQLEQERRDLLHELEELEDDVLGYLTHSD
jgi:trichohyalin